MKTFIDKVNELYSKKVEILNQLDECECSIMSEMYENLTYAEVFINSIIDWVLLLPQEAFAYYEAAKNKIANRGTSEILTVDSNGNFKYGEEESPNLRFMNEDVQIVLNEENEQLRDRFINVVGCEPDEEIITVNRAWIRDWFTEDTGYPHDITIQVEGMCELVPLAIATNSINRTGWQSTLEISQYPVKCERVVEIMEEYFDFLI